MPDVAWDLVEFADKPLTLILDEAVNLAPSLIAEDGSIGLRVTKENISHELCYRFEKAIVSTSANISGQPSPACFNEISDEIKQGVDYIMRSRQNDLSKSKPSQIIKMGIDGEIQPVHCKGDQSWVFFGSNDAKAETPVLWPPHVKRSEERRVGKEC